MSAVSSRLNAPLVVNRRTLTLCLAYVHYYTPYLQRRRCFLAASHLRPLAALVGYPSPQLRTLRCHPPLAAHFCLLTAATLLTNGDTCLATTPQVMPWLYEKAETQLEQLLAAMGDCDGWTMALAQVGAAEAMTIDYTAYIEQTLRRQITAFRRSGADDSVDAAEPAAWVSGPEVESWQLALPQTVPPWLLFDLFQLGHWQPGSCLHLTPLTIASPPACYYGFEHIRWLLETATQQPLPAAKQAQLRQWLRRADAYQLTGPLLSTAQPEQMAAVRANRRLRPYLLRQIGPRHTLIHPELIPRLRRWLARQGYPLNVPAAYQPLTRGDLDSTYHWLGLRLLVTLQKQIRLPYPAPTEQLFRLSQALPPEKVMELEQVAAQISHDLDAMHQHRDAFFPAYALPTPQLIEQIESAIRDSHTLTLSYQAAGEAAPKQHEVEPYWLERRDQLAYLHAYSYRAEAELTFRLDRVVNLAFTQSLPAPPAAPDPYPTP